MIKTINSWRGLIAVSVVMFHCRLTWAYNYAVSGVTFFFLSSAFLLVLRHDFDRFDSRQYGRFVLNHAARLYPLHWLGLALLVMVALYSHSPVDWPATALNALLLHGWSPVHNVHYGINPVTWYMGALLFCNMILPFLSRWMGPWRFRYKVLAVTSLALLLAAVLWPLDIPRREAIFVNPLSHIPDVLMALMLVHLYRVLKSSFPRVNYATATAIELGALLLLAASFAVNVATTWVRPWEDDLYWLLPCGLVLLTMAFLHGQEGFLGRLLMCRPLQWLGSISFEVYVLHFAVFHIYNYIISPLAGHYGFRIYGLLPVLVWPLLFALAWMVNRWFTRPISAFLKQKINR